MSNVILLKHHPMNVKFTNTFYTSQVDDNLSDYIIVDVTSRVVRNKEFMNLHPKFEKEISPFFIGPVVSSDGVNCNIFEIFWQCGKVYPCHDNGGTPTQDFFNWRNDFYSKTICSKDLMRHACKDLGYEHKDARYFAYYDKQSKKYLPLGYKESYKKVYIPEYAKLVYNTNAVKFLKSVVDSGKKLALVDFDGANFYSTSAMKKRYQSYINKCKNDNALPVYDESTFTDIKTPKAYINSPFPSGHAIVLKLLLDGEIEVINGNVIDHTGVLE